MITLTLKILIAALSMIVWPLALLLTGLIAAADYRQSAADQRRGG